MGRRGESYILVITISSDSLTACAILQGNCNCFTANCIPFIPTTAQTFINKCSLCRGNICNTFRPPKAIFREHADTKQQICYIKFRRGSALTKSNQKYSPKWLKHRSNTLKLYQTFLLFTSGIVYVQLANSYIILTSSSRHVSVIGQCKLRVAQRHVLCQLCQYHKALCFVD